LFHVPAITFMRFGQARAGAASGRSRRRMQDEGGMTLFIRRRLVL